MLTGTFKGFTYRVSLGESGFVSRGDVQVCSPHGMEKQVLSGFLSGLRKESVAFSQCHRLSYFMLTVFQFNPQVTQVSSLQGTQIYISVPLGRQGFF